MIDWLTFELNWPHAPIRGDMVMRVTPDGEILWNTACAVMVTGSFDNSIQVSSVGCSGESTSEYLRISGNPIKFLTGQNIFGTDNLFDLIDKFLASLFPILGFQYNSFVRNRINSAKLYRIDITYNYSLNCRGDVINWLRASEFAARSRSGRPVSKGSTLYFQKNSRRWAFKFYSKGQELEVHRLSDKLSIDDTLNLVKFSDRLLRAELTLRRKELVKIDCDTILNFISNFTCENLFSDYMSRLNFNSEKKIFTENFFTTLPEKLRGTYILWREGHNPLMFMSRATFYRHRSELLVLGIDISIPLQGGGDTSGYIPIIRELSAERIITPDWANKFIAI